MASPFDGRRQRPLMTGTTSRNTAGDDFAPFGDKSFKKSFVAIINIADPVFAKPAMPFSSSFHGYTLFNTFGRRPGNGY